MGYMFSTNKLRLSIRSVEQTLPIVQWIDSRFDCMVYGSKILSLSLFGDFVKTIAAGYDKLLEEDILVGLRSANPVFHYDYNHIIDDPRNTAVGYSFLNDERNSFAQHRRTLITQLIINPRLQGKFHFMSGSNLVWRPGPCQRLLKADESATHLLFTLCHVSYGQPAIGSQVANWLLRNVQDGYERNIYDLNGCLTFIGDRPDRLRRQRRSAWVPADMVAQRLIFNWTIVRPAMVTLAHYLRDQATSRRLYIYVFPGLGRRWTGEDLSSHLAEDTEQILGVKLQILDYDRIVAAYGSNHQGLVKPQSSKMQE
jgi:hypothetical protein